MLAKGLLGRNGMQKVQKIQSNIFSKVYYFAFESLQCNSVSIQVAEWRLNNFLARTKRSSKVISQQVCNMVSSVKEFSH